MNYTQCAVPLIVFGILLLLVAGSGYLYTHPDHWRGIRAWLAGFQKKPDPLPATKQPLSRTATDALPVDATMDEMLRVVEPKQAVQFLGGRDLAVRASVVLTPLTQYRGGPWQPNRMAEPCTGIVFSNGEWIFKVPSREQGKLLWLKGKIIPGADPMEFFMGTKGGPDGPARRFRKNGQTTPVHFVLPGKLTPGLHWQVVDLGAFGVQVKGRADEMKPDDRLYSVVAQEVGGDHWLLYLDARQNEARGTGGLFFCQEFQPDVEVQTLL